MQNHKYINKKRKGGKWEYTYSDDTNGDTTHKPEAPKTGIHRFSKPEVVKEDKVGATTERMWKTPGGYNMTEFDYDSPHANSHYSVSGENGKVVKVETRIKRTLVAAILDRVGGDAAKFDKAFIQGGFNGRMPNKAMERYLLEEKLPKKTPAKKPKKWDGMGSHPLGIKTPKKQRKKTRVKSRGLLSSSRNFTVVGI